MKYFQVVQLFQSSKDVDDGLPDVVFVEVLLFLFIAWRCWVYADLPETFALEKGLLVADDVGVVDRGEDSNLIECVFCLFIRQIG